MFDVDGVHTSTISLRPEHALRGSGDTNGIDTETVPPHQSSEMPNVFCDEWKLIATDNNPDRYLLVVK